MKVYIKDEVIESMKTRFIPKGCIDVTDERSLMTAIEMMLHGANAFEIILCKDCRWWNGNQETMHNNHLCRNWSKFGSINTSANDFCSYGERKGGGSE